MGLKRYIFRRLLLVIPVLIGVSIIIFSLTRMAGDPAAAYINEKMNASQIADVYQKYHFNEPAYVQYFYWLNGILNLDWGWSKTAAMPVTDAIAYYLPATFELALTSIVIAIIAGIALGTTSAVKKNKPFDHTTRVVSLVGVSIPVFWLGLLLLLIFYAQLGLFPKGGRYSDIFILTGVTKNLVTGFMTVDSLIMGNLNFFADVIWHLILPAITLSFASIALILRMQRNSMLEVLHLDYIKTARAKGVPEKAVVRKHARRNALIPTTTVVGLAFGGLLSGAVLTESIFSWPGLGRWSAKSILRMDTASILGFCLLIAFIYVIANLVVDIMYAYLDPRVKLG